MAGGAKELDELAAAYPAVSIRPVVADLATDAGVDVVKASLRGLELNEVVCAPGVEQTDLLDSIFKADLAAFGAQSPNLATRYRN